MTKTRDFMLEYSHTKVSTILCLLYYPHFYHNVQRIGIRNVVSREMFTFTICFEYTEAQLGQIVQKVDV